MGIYRKLAAQNPGIHLFDLATTLRLLGSIYTNNKQNTLAEKYYLEALDVYREMARQMPDRYLGTLADALSDVSKYYRDINQAQKSEELSGEALDVCGLWAERASVLKKPRSLIFLGKFYLNNAQFADAEKMLMQAIDLVRKNNFQNAWELSSLASSITDLGNDFARAGKAEQAEKACEESIRIFRKLAMENQAAFLDELARSLEALSRIHRKNKQFSQATAEQEESLGLYRKLANINPDVFMPELASNLYLFGIFNDQPLQAEKALEESSDIYRKLARQNPDVFLPELAKTLRSLSKVNNKEKTWLEALEVARRLAQEKDSEVFIEDLASCLFEIMRYYGKNNGVDKAEKAGIESIDIYRKLADKNPDAFLKTLAFHLSYLAEFYRRHKINDKAEKFYIESVDMFRELAGKNPDDHLLRLARTLSDLGQFYEKNSQKAQAEKAYREAFDLYPKLDVKQLGWYDAGNLFEISKFFSPEDPLTTEKACRGAVNIYRNLEEQNPGEYTEDLISMLTNLGIFYMANGKSEDAEKVHSEAFSLYRKSHEGITDTFLTDLAYQLREFGYGYEEAQQYGPALKCYHKGLVTCHTNAKVKSDDFYFEWERLVSRVFEIQNKSFDSAQYDIAIRAALVLAESMDSMQRFDAQFKAVVVSEYVSLSWYYLFVRQYKESAYYAEKARSLDPAQNLARTNLGHSYLYRNDWKRAEQIYEEYLKNEKDLSEAKNILLKDWDDLEKAGLTHKSLVKAREWLNRQ